jgi:hypothetical protein
MASKEEIEPDWVRVFVVLMMGDYEVVVVGGGGGWWWWWASVCGCIPAAAIDATKLVLKSECTSTKLPTLEDEEKEKRTAKENRKICSKRLDLSDWDNIATCLLTHKILAVHTGSSSSHHHLTAGTVSSSARYASPNLWLVWSNVATIPSYGGGHPGPGMGG